LVIFGNAASAVKCCGNSADLSGDLLSALSAVAFVLRLRKCHIVILASYVGAADMSAQNQLCLTESRFSANRVGPLPGWYAISVNYLYDRDHQYQYLLNCEPVAMIGYSIYIYHISLDKTNRIRRQFGLDELTQD